MMNLQSLGHAAALFQQDPRIIRVAIKAVQLKTEPAPALTLDGIEYFTTDDIVSAVKWLAENDAKTMIQGVEV
jgi:hypothetical protein